MIFSTFCRGSWLLSECLETKQHYVIQGANTKEVSFFGAWFQLRISENVSKMVTFLLGQGKWVCTRLVRAPSDSKVSASITMVTTCLNIFDSLLPRYISMKQVVLLALLVTISISQNCSLIFSCTNCVGGGCHYCQRALSGCYSPTSNAGDANINCTGSVGNQADKFVRCQCILLISEDNERRPNGML